MIPECKKKDANLKIRHYDGHGKAQEKSKERV